MDLTYDNRSRNAERSASLPPRPVLAFRIGVTGARDLDARPVEVRRAISRQVREVLEMIRDQVASIACEPGARAVYAQPEPRLRLLSPLAEGADRLVAEVALELGYELDVALPFERAEYVRDFADDASKAAFNRFLRPETARSLGTCFALDGGRGDDEARSYEAVGRVVVRNCDLLIAIWDGRPARGRGGTADIVRFSARFGPPIWSIDPAGNAPARLIQTTADLRAPGWAPQAAAAERLTDLIGALLRPPHVQRHRHSLIGRAMQALHAGWPGEANSDDPLQDYLCRQPPADYPVWRLFSWGSRAIGGAPSRPPLPAMPAPSGSIAYWDDLYRPADQASKAYGNRYRSSYLWIFALAALAVTSAVTALAFEPIKPAATTIEILLLLTILGLVAVNERRNWHGRWIACRLLAELCRKQSALAALAWSLPPPILRRSLYAVAQNQVEHPPAEAWVGWYFGAFLRAAPLPTSDISGARLREIRDHIRIAFVEAQHRYQRDRHHRSRRAGRWLVRAGECAFLATLIMVVVKLALIGASDGHHTDGLHAAVVILGSLAAVMPAVSATFVGIRAYAELELLEQQATRMVYVMETAGARINALTLDQPLASQDLAAEIFEVSSDMLQDVSGWADLFRVKAIEAG